MRRLLLFFAMFCVSIGTWAAPIGSGSGTYEVADGVVTFSRTTAGEIYQNWSSLNFSGATRIKFDNTCSINQADLEKFLQGNTYYVDLFDITNGTNTPMKIDDYTTPDDDNNANNIDKIIEAAVEDMVNNNWQAKGIILPLNTGSGTTKVEQNWKNGGDKSGTFREYVVYYRESQETISIYSHDIGCQYNPGGTSVDQAQSNYNTAYSHLSDHNISSATSIIVSSNNSREINLSNLSAANSATPNLTAKISIVNDEWVYRTTLADIYVELTETDGFANAVLNTNIDLTPCDRLVIEGPVSADDVTAINSFNSSTAEGPHLYDIKGAEVITIDMLSGINNSKVEYIILPNDMASVSIPASTFDLDQMSSLKAAIATSTDGKLLSAFVGQPGSLARARRYATGTAYDDIPATTGLTNVILSGILNGADIAANTSSKHLDANGHWSNGGNNLVPPALNSEQGTLASMDLTNAVFQNRTHDESSNVIHDMMFSYAGLQKLINIKLPTDPRMTTIPAYCFEGIQIRPDGTQYNDQTLPKNPADVNDVLTEICIPYNYQYIEDGAFLNTFVNHITTTSAPGPNGEEGALIDNGPLTYTLSSNLKQLGNKPDDIRKPVKDAVFPQNAGVLEVYSLATKTPICYKGVFPRNVTDGWGGMRGANYPYCRDKYYNDDNNYKAFAVLRFPSEASFEAVTDASKKENNYEQMKKNYTDIYKVYTKIEQTGAVDANGDPITWPTQSEFYRVYSQACLGLTWTDWKYKEDEGAYDVNHEICGGVPRAEVGNDGYYHKQDEPAAGDRATTYSFDQYAGWHQITLTQATHVNPDEFINEQEEIVRNYENAGLYTFCIPYDLTTDEVCELMGVPASDDSKKIVNMFDHKKVTAENGPIMPKIYQLASVTRYKGSSASDNNVVNFILSSDLYNNGAPQYLEIDHGTELIEALPAADEDHPNRCLVGGRPYIIQAYKRTTETISKNNLGKYVMTRYADKFDESASCLNNGLYEQLKNSKGEALATLRFAIPYEQHKVQAVRRGGELQPLTYDDGDGDKKYYYTMVGQYWEQDLPLYCIYMSGQMWYRYTGTYQGKTVKYKWAPYKCIIMPSQEIDERGGGYRDDSRSQIPTVSGTDLLDKDFQLGFLDGRNDDDFNSGNGAKYVYTFDDGITVYDADGNMTTAIKQLDGEDLTIGTGNGKVYNMSGQQVGKSLEGLGKGLYIVNGKKVVVK